MTTYVFGIHIRVVKKNFSFELCGPTGIYDLAFSPDSSLLAVGSERSIEVWDMLTKKQKQVLYEGPSYSGNHVNFSPNGLMLAGGINQDTNYGKVQLRLWGIGDVINGHSGYELQLTGNSRYCISDLAFSPDSRNLVSAHGNEIKFWRLSM